MKRRTRKSIGAAAMLIFVLLYAVCAMVLAEAKPVHDAPGVIQAVFYAVVGLAWILPLMPLITWMERPDADSQT